MSFLDPLLTSDGRPYAPERYKQIVMERYQITKRIHTSYNDLAQITPRERELLLEFIKDDIEHDNKIYEQMSNKNS